MIVESTPGCLICGLKDGREVIFEGEWTLEPKFYLSNAKSLRFKNGRQLSGNEASIALDTLLEDARERGWTIVV